MSLFRKIWVMLAVITSVNLFCHSSVPQVVKGVVLIPKVVKGVALTPKVVKGVASTPKVVKGVASTPKVVSPRVLFAKGFSRPRRVIEGLRFDCMSLSHQCTAGSIDRHAVGKIQSVVPMAEKNPLVIETHVLPVTNIHQGVSEDAVQRLSEDAIKRKIETKRDSMIFEMRYQIKKNKIPLKAFKEEIKETDFGYITIICEIDCLNYDYAA